MTVGHSLGDYIGDVMRETSDETRFRELYQRYQRPVLAYALRRTDRASSLDVAAETFLVAWRRIGDVPSGDDDAARLWLYGVARRVLANQRRSNKRFRALRDKLAGIGTLPDPTPETVVVRRAEDEETLAAVARLRPRDQELLRLATWEELPRADIAEMLGTSRHAVRQRLYRITKQLGRELRTVPIPRAPGTTPQTSEGGECV